MGAVWSQESHFQEEPWVLLVHSPLLQQSRLLAVPPLSDMLKFGGSFHVRQVTIQIASEVAAWSETTTVVVPFTDIARAVLD